MISGQSGVPEGSLPTAVISEQPAESWQGDSSRTEVVHSLSLAAHELRAPVTVIQGFAEVMERELGEGKRPDPAALRRAIAAILEQSVSLLHLLDEMLDLSAVEQGRLRLHCERHDLVRILAAVVEGQQLTSKRHRVCLVLDGLLREEGLPAWCDAVRLTQVLHNLVGNAIKYSPAGGTIEVGLRRGGGESALIWVRDQGIGISAEAQRHLFQLFHRGHSREGGNGGLGIGLYLARELVALHGGRIWVESCEGRGSTFSVLLPLSGP